MALSGMEGASRMLSKWLYLSLAGKNTAQNNVAIWNRYVQQTTTLACAQLCLRHISTYMRREPEPSISTFKKPRGSLMLTARIMQWKEPTTSQTRMVFYHPAAIRIDCLPLSHHRATQKNVGLEPGSASRVWTALQSKPPGATSSASVDHPAPAKSTLDNITSTKRKRISIPAAPANPERASDKKEA